MIGCADHIVFSLRGKQTAEIPEILLRSDKNMPDKKQALEEQNQWPMQRQEQKQIPKGNDRKKGKNNDNSEKKEKQEQRQ